MLRILGHSRRMCDGLTRRELMRVGGLSLFGAMTTSRLLRAGRFRLRPQRTAQAVILFNLLGGPSHQDMFDMKPAASPEIRGEFQPIDTSLPGLQICEHLANSARLMHKASLIRTVTHNYNSHNPLALMTGFAGGEKGQLTADPTDPPDIGAVCQYLGMGRQDVPGAVCMPCFPGWGESKQYPGIRRPGPYGGFLGSQYDPLFSVCDPKFARDGSPYEPVRPMGASLLPAFDALPDMTANRLDRRWSILEQLDRTFESATDSSAVARMDQFQRRAFSLLTSSKTRDAFDLSQEPDKLRDAYGRNLFGSSLLQARRLVESGVTFVSVHAENFYEHGFTYDMHENNFHMLKDENLPVLDMAWPTLIRDLEDRGLLDSTLVVVMGEMGRSPRVNKKAGRDHWPQCGFSLLAGGGIKQGTLFGATDKRAAYPISHPVSPADIVATIYELLGIDPQMTVPDMSGRPVPIAHGGEPIWEIIA